MLIPIQIQHITSALENGRNCTKEMENRPNIRFLYFPDETKSRRASCGYTKTPKSLKTYQNVHEMQEIVKYLM